jgi:outer membrane protein
MRLKILIGSAFCVLLGAFSTGVQAQTPKYGHMNLGNLLEQLPATAKANTALTAVGDSLGKVADSMGKAFETAYKKLETDYSSRTLTPVQFEERKAALQKQQADLQEFDTKAQAYLEDRRNSLLEPILTEVREAIKVVAKENGYLMVFDISSGAMLFAAEADDVTELVKKKMGM